MSLVDALIDGNATWERQRAALSTAVRHLGAKEVAFVLGTRENRVLDALDGRGGKVWHARWTHVIKAMLAREPAGGVADALLRTIVKHDAAFEAERAR